jgi:UrcA family protein
MNTVTSKISDLIQESEARSPSKISNLVHDPEVRSAALFWIMSVLGTSLLALIVCLLGITPAWSNTPDPPSVTVRYADLDLSSPAGADALYRRIQAAARQVCGFPGTDLVEQSSWRSCYRSAVGDAVRKVNSPLLIAVQSGKPAAMTAMAAK